jgi:hypothetical protein
MIAVVAFLVLPAIVIAGEETVIPPEANRTPSPPPAPAPRGDRV